MKKMLLIVGLFIAGATFVVFAPTLRFDFVHLGDEVSVVHNPYFLPLTVHNGMNYALRPYGNVWAPLTHLSHALDVALWNLNPFGHYFSSVVLHSINAMLVFWLALNVIVAYKERIRGFVHATPEEATNAAVITGSVIAALLFALHPLRVASVSWVSARADVVAGFFTLLTAIFYFTRAEAPERLLGKRLLIIIAFTMALMASESAMVLPFVFVLLDRFLLKRTMSQSMKEQLPLLVLAAIRFLILGIVEDRFAVSVAMTFLSWIHIVGVLLHKVFLLSSYSPVNSLTVSTDALFISGATVVAASAFAIYKWKRASPHWMLAWFSFVVLLAPMFVAKGYDDRLFVDGFTYIASVGFCLLIGGGVERVSRVGAERTFAARTSGAVVLACLVVFTAMTWTTLQQQKRWRAEATPSSTLSFDHRLR